MSSWAIAAGIGLLTTLQSLPADPVVPAPAAAAPAEPSAPDGIVRLPAALPIDIETAQEMGSNTSRIDEMFAIRLSAPVVVDGKVVLPLGLVGQGQVVHAARSTGFGKAGELILAARFVDCGALRIPLRGMRFENSGKDKSGQVFALYAATAPIAGVLAIPLAFMSGGKVVIPAGTHATAKLSAQIDIPVGGCPLPAAATVNP